MHLINIYFNNTNNKKSQETIIMSWIKMTLQTTCNQPCQHEFMP